MDYEKAYKKAVEKLRYKISDKDGNIDYNEVVNVDELQDIFPELAETEDERIRNGLIALLKFGLENGSAIAPGSNVTKEQALAWLEKQGQKFQYWKPSEEQLEALDYAYNSCPDTERGNYYEGVLETIIDDLHKFSEKQGEQKPNEKVEPKFHEGDWIVYKNDICQIVKREEGCNKLVTTFGIEKELVNERNLSTARLWTINDAKDGDVLACENGWTCIFNCLNDNLFSSHCFMDNEGWFCKDGGQGHTLDNRICGEIHPATKEQSEYLFAKMREACYEWDAESKQILSLKAEPTRGFNGNEGKISPKWSKEDEEEFKIAIETLHEAGQHCSAMWLKSLKQRME